MYRAFRYKLAPTTAQEERFSQFAGVCRLVYNLALEQRRDFWRQYEAQTVSRITCYGQSRELTLLRAEFDFIKDVCQSCEQKALQDLDVAFTRFFTGKGKFPTPRVRGVNDTFRFQGREVSTRPLNSKWGEVRLPKIGWVRFRDTRPIKGDVISATVSRDGDGWYVSFASSIQHNSEPSDLPTVGIDRGVVNSITLSTGETLSLPKSVAAIERKVLHAKRAMSRCVRGSARHAKARRRVVKLAIRRVRIRKDWHHRTSLQIAKNYGHVVLESLNIRSLTASARGTIEAPGRNVRAKAALNRSILNQGWGSFAAILAYKLEERGGELVFVNPAYTSQTCSECGTVDRESRESQASFACLHCGFRAHADHNAAINILRRSTAPTRMEDRHWPTVEVRTIGDFPVNLPDHLDGVADTRTPGSRIGEPA